MLTVLQKFDTRGTSCPICGMSDDTQSILIPIDGTDGKDYDGKVEVLQIHVKCMSLRAHTVPGRPMMIYMPVGKPITEKIEESIDAIEKSIEGPNIRMIRKKRK